VTGAAPGAAPPGWGPRVGLGVDVHGFGGPGPLRLGGVVVPHPVGLIGHSDGDALCHAVADAVLGAAGLPDLGHHFPSADPATRGADSTALLRHAARLTAAAGWVVGNCDATVVAEAPRLGPHVVEMGRALADALGVEPGRVSVKAKSSDGLGLVGRGEGVVALATVCLVRESAPMAPGGGPRGAGRDGG